METLGASMTGIAERLVVFSGFVAFDRWALGVVGAAAASAGMEGIVVVLLRRGCDWLD